MTFETHNGGHGMTLTKLARKRDNTVPPGTAAALYLDCPCGSKVYIPLVFTGHKTATVECYECKAVYTHEGWIVQNGAL